MSDVIPHEPSYTVDEFCKAERISRVALYAMWRSDRGPRFYLNGRCRRITHKARLDWQAEREAEVNGGTNTPPEAIAPAEVLQDQGEGEEERKKCTDESTPLKPKRKLGGVWREGRYYTGSARPASPFSMRGSGPTNLLCGGSHEGFRSRNGHRYRGGNPFSSH